MIALAQLLAGYAEQVPMLDVRGVALDSRAVAPGDVFLACAGHAAHGLTYAEAAIARGAVAVIWEPSAGVAAPTLAVPCIAVTDLARRAGVLAARVYGQPSAALFCVGITGTDGKTSTAHVLAQTLDRLAQPCGYIGTLGWGRVGALATAAHTTPDAVSLQRHVALLRDDGVQTLALEVSSHALDQDRIAGMALDVAVLTHISRDHLDYHGSLAAYVAAKRKLFTRNDVHTLVLNRDDAYGRAWAQQLGADKQVIVYGLDGETPSQGAYVIGRALTLHADGMTLQIDTEDGQATLHSALLGRFNAYNLLATLAVLRARGIALAAAVAALAQARTVPGRIEAFRGPSSAALVVVDYAHTPDALAQVLSALRAHTAGRLICVFGCGGDRDRGKRPLMAQAVAATADVYIITDDNPRSENPAAIIDDILAGLNSAQRSQAQVIHERAHAIRSAVVQAQAGDTVVVAGKGHETTQTYATQTRHFSDRACVAALVGTEVAA